VLVASRGYEHQRAILNLAELQELDARWLMPTYTRAPVEFVRGEGARLWDGEGKVYLDFLAGISVSSIGHCHPAVVATVREQVGVLTHTSNLYLTEGGVRLAERLCRSSLGGKAFLCNSGTEANEAAIKLVRKHAHERGIAEPEIVVLEGAFHGRTMGSLSATPGMSSNESFAPYLPGFRVVPRADPVALGEAVTERTAAVMLEPIQGETGVHVVPDEVIAAAREACDRAGALLVFDEVQTGMGRTGSLWAYEQLPARPDVMTTAKALGGGLPVGACVAGETASEVLGRGEHGSTFAGGPLVSAAALAVLSVIEDPELLRRVRELGGRLRHGLEELGAVAEVRGRGLMLGARLESADAGDAASRLLDEGLLVNPIGKDTLRVLPPLIITEAEVDEALAILGRVLG
jgi:acetylornithine/N-succinyldiaminopimelate aminotransferase